MKMFFPDYERLEKGDKATGAGRLECVRKIGEAMRNYILPTGLPRERLFVSPTYNEWCVWLPTGEVLTTDGEREIINERSSRA